eukprot:scaffold1104_cov299-Prasinococcus_capsulatus_cf.AAC.22
MRHGSHGERAHRERRRVGQRGARLAWQRNTRPHMSTLLQPRAGQPRRAYPTWLGMMEGRVLAGRQGHDARL